MNSGAMSAGPGLIIPICEFQESPSSMRGLVLEVRLGLAECLSETFRNEYRIIAKAGGASDHPRHHEGRLGGICATALRLNIDGRD